MVAHANQTTYQLSGLGQAYQTLYSRLAGSGVSVKPWHFQWLGAYAIRRDLKARLSNVRGRLLDVGCERKPYGVDQFFGKQMEVKELASQGALGSTAGVMLLNWYDAQMDQNKFTRLLKGVTLPFYLVIAFLINMIGYIFDRLDRAEDFYHNVMLIGTNPSQ